MAGRGQDPVYLRLLRLALRAQRRLRGQARGVRRRHTVVRLPYVPMHDSTRLMVVYLTAAITARGVAVERFDLTTLDAGELASSPASSVVRSKRSTATPRAVSAAVRYSTMSRVLSCIVTYGRQTMFRGSPPAQSR